jgi:TatD family-associated radical SAM protein
MKKGLSYWIGSKLYLALTNECNSVTKLAARGPNFPWAKTFEPLSRGYEPSAQEVFDAVDSAFKNGKIAVGSMESDEISIAGLGEPLLRLDTLLRATELIKEKYHGVPLRLKTNGLIPSVKSAAIVKSLKNAGIDQMSVTLMTDNPKQFDEIMAPQGASFSDVCAFIIACSEAGMHAFASYLLKRYLCTIS